LTRLNHFIVVKYVTQAQYVRIKDFTYVKLRRNICILVNIT